MSELNVKNAPVKSERIQSTSTSVLRIHEEIKLVYCKCLKKWRILTKRLKKMKKYLLMLKML
jgi:hypothetical protein